ncbi:hypothetical protein MTR67_005239 [Solanum verrucosum]|uniref:DUF3444 domain-containing protein n=1 Tax=Solanum verrucosum TaxID=315347 RepID=A0AAF0Q1Q2_SOLVR|nr:hypothetical protein MTR67_005239 [Solanum verrucosum]
MTGSEDKTLLCFCHWGKKNKALPDGSTAYVRGTEQIIVKTGIKYNDFVNAVFDQSGIEPSDKFLHFTVKFDWSELIRLRDQEGVNALLQFNDDSAHVYASHLEDEPYSRPPSDGVKKVECIVDSDLESDIICDSDCHEMYDYPDPEFNDFDKHRARICVAVDKIWAYYDKADGMPRHYTLIRKCVKAKRGQYVVFPRKGEIWAFFKDRDINRSSSTNNQREYKYKVVEILSEYVKNVGVKVRSLDKVIGFVSLFQRARMTAVGTFFINPNELHKFSHRIPSFNMTGTERKGVPAGSFELDPYALPLNPNDVWYPGKVKECMP